MTKLVPIILCMFTHLISPPLYKQYPIALIATATSFLVWTPLLPELASSIPCWLPPDASCECPPHPAWALTRMPTRWALLS